mgnify:CR=1 FL=1
MIGGRASSWRPVVLVALLALAGTMGLGAAWAADAAWDGPEAVPEVTSDTLRGTVVLLHGLGRTHRSMRPMEASLEAAGYRVVNLGYPSREHTVTALADTLAAALDRCCADDAGPVHFVTHSLGGIVVRQFLATHPFDRLGRVVMLSPPNQGSEIIDRLPPELLDRVLGPAAAALSTDSTAVPARLPPAGFELGVITGDASINPLFSWWLPGEDDGKVSVESAWVEGTDDFLVVPYTHAFIMRRDQVMRQVLACLLYTSDAADE